MCGKICSEHNLFISASNKDNTFTLQLTFAEMSCGAHNER